MKADVAIIGGGPGGAATALFLARTGVSSVIVEKEPFPRYHIGESMTGECGNLIRELGLEPEMLRRRHPIKYGVCVYGPRGTSWFVPVMGRSPAGELCEGFTWQVRRSGFDEMLLDAAGGVRGVSVVQGRATAPLRADDGQIAGVRVALAGGGVEEIRSEVAIDASGQATFLCHAGVTGPKRRGAYDRQVAVFSQVTGAIRDPGKDRGNTLIFYQRKWHWAWFIPLDDELVSVGVVVPVAYFRSKKESKRDFLVRELRELSPELARRVPEVVFTEEVRAIPNYSYQVAGFTGRGYVCIGDAHRFIDPIFSFGLYVTVQEARFAASAVKAYLEGAHRDDPDPFADHRRRCEQGLDTVEDVIDCFWEEPLAFARFVHYRYREELIDLLAGRFYSDSPSRGLLAMRAAVGHPPRASRSSLAPGGAT